MIIGIKNVYDMLSYSYGYFTCVKVIWETFMKQSSSFHTEYCSLFSPAHSVQRRRRHAHGSYDCKHKRFLSVLLCPLTKRGNMQAIKVLWECSHHPALCGSNH